SERHSKMEWCSKLRRIGAIVKRKTHPHLPLPSREREGPIAKCNGRVRGFSPCDFGSVVRAQQPPHPPQASLGSPSLSRKGRGKMQGRAMTRTSTRATNRYDLAGKAAIVTGGAGGIGLAIAERLLASGARVSLWDRSATALAAARNRLGVETC